MILSGVGAGQVFYDVICVWRLQDLRPFLHSDNATYDNRRSGQCHQV